jgi:protein-disulfide isomerase
MKRRLPFVIVALVAFLTVAGGALLYRVKQLPILTIPENRIAPGMEDRVIHVRGNPKAPVTIEEFGDFECAFCSHFADVIKQVEQDFGDRLRVIFRNFPLPIHQHAREAAFAAEAAGLQGRFWEMHDLLYREQAIWSKTADVRELFSTYAGRLELNTELFQKDMVSEQIKERVAFDEKLGHKLGIDMTPTIFINNKALPAASLNPAGLRAAIDNATKSQLSDNSPSDANQKEQSK